MVIPYKIMLPVSLNMLEPIPFINPSSLLSIAALVIEWANPVVGIIKPHLQNDTISSNIPRPVSTDDIVTKSIIKYM